METHPTGTIDLVKTMGNILFSIQHYRKTVAAVMLVFLGSAGYYSFFGLKVYESKMLLQSDVLSESYALKLGEQINDHVKDSDFAYLAETLHLSLEEASSLRQITLSSALSPMSQQMPEKEKIIMVVTVRLTDNSLLPKVQEGIVSYLKNNPYIVRRVAEKKKELEGLVSSMDLDIKRLDTLKNRISNGSFAGVRGNALSMLDVSNLYTGTVELYEAKFKAEADLALVDSIQIVEGLTPYQKPVWPKKSIMLASAFLMGLLVTYFLIALQMLKEKSTRTSS